METIAKMKNKPEHILNVNVYNFGMGGLSTIVYNWGMKMKSEQYIFDYCGWKHIPSSCYTESIIKRGGRIYSFAGDSNNKILRYIQRAEYLKKIIKENNYRCVHIHADRAQNVLIYAIMAKVSGAEKIIVHSHSSGIDNEKQRIRKSYHNISKKFLPFVATDYLACSIEAARWMYTKKILKRNKFVIINNGIEISKFRFDAQTRIKVRKELGWEKNYILAHIGRFSYPKNHEFLIKTFAELFNRNKKVRLLLIGQGELYKDIENQVNNLGLQYQIKYIPSTNDVNKYMQAMDMFLLPSRFEGLPLVSVEAQASGLKSILSDKISKQAKLTELVQYRPIDEGTESWIAAIESTMQTEYDRKVYADIVEKKGYGIEASAQRIQEIYSEKSKRDTGRA